jgi:hypothetical protein
MNEPVFTHEVFLNHSAKDKAVVRPLAERLWADGLKVWLVPPKLPGVGGFDEWECHSPAGAGENSPNHNFAL